MKTAIAALALVGAGIAWNMGDDEEQQAVESAAIFGPTTAFERIYLDGAATIRLHQGDAPEVDLKVDPDHRDLVKVEVSDGALFVEVDETLDRDEVELDLTVVTLSEFVSAGAVRLESDGLQANDLVIEDRGSGVYEFSDLSVDELLIEARGASSFDLDGSARRQVVDIAGAGKYNAPHLESDSTEISLKGAGKATVWANEALDVLIAGAGSVEYAGSPEVEKSILGAGSVRQLSE